MLYRIEGMKNDAHVVHFKLSALKPANRTAKQMHVMMSLLEDLLAHSRSRLFLMSDGDLFIVGRNIPHPVLQKTISSIRQLYQADPVVSMSAEINFCEVYDLGYEFDSIVKLAQRKSDIAKNAKRRQLQNQNQNLIPLAPEHLDAILRNIQGFNVLKVIRRQEAIQITRSGKYCSLFQEYFTSMADLKAAIAPDVDVLSNRWLFQHLSETLDKRMLSVHKELFARTPGGISLNLNISTIFTKTFEEFLNSVPESKTIVVEVQLMDIIQNTRNFIMAKDLLHEAGHKILIDGLHPISFRFLDLTLLDPDLVKLNWSPAIPENTDTPPLEETIKEIDSQKIILMRCEDEESIKWGLTNGISRFQGYFIDALSGAGIKRKCKRGNVCSLQECISRKSCIAGPVRSQCLYQGALDTPIEENL